VFKYLRGTVRFGLRYVKGDGVRLLGYLDSNWADRAVDRNITYGGFFILGSAVVSWFSKRQTFVALSLVDVEHMVASLAICEDILSGDGAYYDSLRKYNLYQNIKESFVS
jgi:hypothetical protein